jgi:hypothetical protein
MCARRWIMRSNVLLKTLMTIPLACFILFMACAGDEDEDWCTEAPSDCAKSAYATGNMSISLTINAENPTVKIYIYQGDIDSGSLYKGPEIPTNPFDWSSSTYTKSLIPFGTYSAKVDYKVGSITVTAVDGAETSSITSEHCDNVTCYDVETADIDLTFDYDAFKEYIEGTDEECFIATAAFGSPLSDEVSALRMFRDSVLRSSSPGRAFIGLYYRYSPPAARFIGRHEPLRAATRGMLYPVVWAVSYPRAFVAIVIALAGICLGFRVRASRRGRNYRD